MKIGILTYHRAENYGALLQAYALMSYLKGLGYDVSFVDYWPKYHSEYFKVFSWTNFMYKPFKSKMHILLRMMLMGGKLLNRKKVMQKFIHEQLSISDKPKYSARNSKTEHYDVVVYGSDQIWRKQNLGGVGFDEWYFGSDNVWADKKIVYAGSMGQLETTPDDCQYVQLQMRHFCNIAVREKDLQSYLKKLDIQSELVVDPVFLLNKEQWHQLAITPKSASKYILFYNLLNSPDSFSFAKALSKETGLPVWEITKKTALIQKGVKDIDISSVEEFLGLIENADYVVTNSFHGVAFSIIFNKQFFAVGMGAKSNRVLSLLDVAGINERYFDSTPHQIQLSQIDYNKVKNRMHNDIELSKEYLANAIS